MGCGVISDELRARIEAMRWAPVRGYGRAQGLYLAAGWTNVLPLPAKKKKPVPVGFTGYKWRTPTPEDLARLANEFPDGNTAVHTGDTLIGFDKDCHSGKTGAATMAEAQRRFGELEPTWSSSSRDDGSGIWWYQAPPGTHLVSEIVFRELGIRHVDVIQSYHRYGVVWPSIHPDTGLTYYWHTPDGVRVEAGTVPGPADFPMLPEGWLEGLKKEVPRHRLRNPYKPTPGSCAWEWWEMLHREEREEERRERQARADTQRERRVRADTPTGGSRGDKVAERLARAVADLDGEGNRHDVTRDHVLAILRRGERGEPGVADALDELCEAFVAAVTGDGTRSPAEAEHEFTRMVDGGEDLIAADPWPHPVVRAPWARQNRVRSSHRRKRVAWGTGGRR